MFGIVLKNSVLMFLIILIIHFFLDNNKKKFIDRYAKNKLMDIQEASIRIYEEDDGNINNINTPPPPVIEKQENNNYDCHEYDTDTTLTLNIDHRVKELYNFVFNDNEAPQQLDDMFSDNIITNGTLSQYKNTVKCADEGEKEKTNMMCKQSMANMLDENTKACDEIVAVDSNTDYHGYIILNEFKGEKCINGGKIFEDMNLLGWDNDIKEYSQL